MTDRDQLLIPLPCPFCGREPHVTPLGVVMCSATPSECPVRPGTGDGLSRDDRLSVTFCKNTAIQRWNTRARGPFEPREGDGPTHADALEQMIRMLQPGDHDKPLWLLVKDITAYSRRYSRALCYALRFDPDAIRYAKDPELHEGEPDGADDLDIEQLAERVAAPYAATSDLLSAALIGAILALVVNACVS